MEELFDVQEVAKKLKLSVSTIYRHVESGVFPCLRVGPNIRFAESHIVAFLTRKSEEAKNRNNAARFSAKLMAAYRDWN
jgi:excisionase family DNA binding protein